MLSVQGLCKTFQEKQKQRWKTITVAKPVLNNVELTAKSGRTLAVLGANGAGKTTTLRCIAGMLSFEAGDISMNGLTAKSGASWRQQIGYLAGTTRLYPRLTVAENLHYFGTLYGMDKTSIQQRIEQLDQQLELGKALNTRVDACSTGMHQKGNIARTLLHDPQLLILDEPTSGLDIMASTRMLEVVKRQRDADRTILLSTHHMHEVAELADDVAIIAKGKVAFNGPVQHLGQHAEDIHQSVTKIIQGVGV
ncbi:ABC transporter ATP-binding protein [Salinibius halmophilus]|uniref:ABC transporter ATP-binding protein n=1 Tax=Salinibius halmophilus TaxID=1853216 RepID=UPI000E6633C8|nr:ABC transporter ATP-binding protein [Salinibius halmophilus]